MSKPEYWDGSWKTRPSLGPVHEFGPSSWRAVHATEYGYVDMQAEQYAHGAYTWLEFICNGRLYRRTICAYYKPRYTARLATQFAREVTEGTVLA